MPASRNDNKNMEAMAPTPARPLGAAPPACDDNTAYVALTTSHKKRIGKGTFMAKSGSFGASLAAKHTRQVELLVVLMRSLRRVELCRRDFIVLLGTQMEMSLDNQRLLQREGMLLHPAPPLVPGVPTMDKLLVWTLTNYTQLAVIDADLMFVRPIDALFGGDAEMTIAHHPYDQLQAQCGVPIAARGIAALFVVRPSLATYNALRSYLLRRFRLDQLLYSDQTGLMCFFGNRTRTLPCPYVYDVSMTLSDWLPKYKRNCRSHVKQHVVRNCLSDIADRCRSIARTAMCSETAAHVQGHCARRSTAMSVHGIHFKGTMKPWSSALNQSCHLLRYGSAVQGREGSLERADVDVPEPVSWDAKRVLPDAERSGACVSERSQRPIYWARTGDGPVTRKCCSTYALMSARWNGLLEAG